MACQPTGSLHKKGTADMGDIGEGQREYEFEPLTAPASIPEPETAPAEAPDREAVPA